ncbi:MAG: RIP metalloprotease RseP [Clostridia bacterium]
MISFIITIAKLLLILGIVATIHEFGHFLMAKLFKIGVEEFSIGFGPKIIQKKVKETMYSLRWLPLGGYCAIEGEEGDSESETSFAKKNPVKKIIVLCMGVVFNAILAVVIFVGIGLHYPTYTSTITKLTPDSVLTKAGIKAGDTIKAIDGKPVKIQADLLDRKDISNKNIEVEYLRDGKIQKTTVENVLTDCGYIGASFKIEKENGVSMVSNEVQLVASGSESVKTGIKAGDRIIEVADIPTNTGDQVVDIVRQNKNKEISIKFDRKGQIISKTITPELKQSFDLGIASTQKVKTTIPYAFVSASNNVKTIAGSYVDLFRGKVGVKDMSGLVGIGEVVSKTNGVLEFLNLMGIISLAVGIANIMPFPPLDGGKIVIVLGETITRKKLPAKAEAIISYIGFGLLIGLTLIVTYNDILRIF